MSNSLEQELKDLEAKLTTDIKSDREWLKQAEKRLKCHQETLMALKSPDSSTSAGS